MKSRTLGIEFHGIPGKNIAFLTAKENQGNKVPDPNTRGIIIFFDPENETSVNLEPATVKAQNGFITNVFGETVTIQYSQFTEDRSTLLDTETVQSYFVVGPGKEIELESLTQEGLETFRKLYHDLSDKSTS